MAELGLLIGVLLFVGAIGCPSCFLARSQQRELSLRQIKEQILETLGLQQAPNITGRQRPNIPPLEGLYDQFQFQADQAHQKEEEEADLTVDKVIAFGQPHPKMRHLKGKELLNFKFSEKMLENRAVNAYLWLFLRATPREDAHPIEITVFKVASDDEPPTLTEINTIKEARTWGSKGHWVKVDVKPLVSEWFKMPNEPMSLAVQASIKEHGKEELSSLTQRLLVTSTRNDASSFMPFLELKVATLKKKRIKRTTGLNCQENSEETRCCRHPLTVDFESFGWDWIIAPKSYEANYCSGECPNIFFQNYPHTHLVHLATPPSSTAGRCCAPRKLSSITMLYFDNNLNIVFGLLPGMVVDRCGCS